MRVFENRVLRKIFGCKRNEVTGVWRRLHKEELCDLCSSPNIIRVIKSGRMKWAEHVARIRRRDVHTGFWWGNLRERAGPREWVRVPVEKKKKIRAPTARANWKDEK